ncbi:Zinc finger, PHD-type [Sesbania bispinosa]|nr:Zinc finger, PHD-type [Sesbania bispinosa]
MAPATSSAASQELVGFSRRTHAPRNPQRPFAPPIKKYRSMKDIMERAHYVVVEHEDYSDLTCDQCRSDERAEELLLCDKCDKGFHMKCVRPIVVRVPNGSWLCPKCSGGKRVRSKGLSKRGFTQKKTTDFFGIDKDSSDFKNKGSSSQGNVLKFRHIYI